MNVEQRYPKTFRRGNIYRIKTMLEQNKLLRFAFVGSDDLLHETKGVSRCYPDYFKRKVTSIVSAGVKCEVRRFEHAQYCSAEAILDLEEVKKWNPNIVFLDFALCDEDNALCQQSFEGIVRQLLECGMAVVIVLFCNRRGGNASGQQKMIGSFYNLSVLDIGTELLDAMGENSDELTEIYIDERHLTEKGHKKVSDYLVLYLRMVLNTIKDNQYSLPTSYCFGKNYQDMMKIDLLESKKDTLFSEKVRYSFLEFGYWLLPGDEDATIEIWIDDEIKYRIPMTTVTKEMEHEVVYLDGDGVMSEHEVRICVGEGKIKGSDLSRMRLFLGVGIQPPTAIADGVL